jgi:hypothetical protein
MSDDENVELHEWQEVEIHEPGKSSTSREYRRKSGEYDSELCSCGHIRRIHTPGTNDDGSIDRRVSTCHGDPEYLSTYEESGIKDFPEVIHCPCKGFKHSNISS